MDWTHAQEKMQNGTPAYRLSWDEDTEVECNGAGEFTIYTTGRGEPWTPTADDTAATDWDI